MPSGNVNQIPGSVTGPVVQAGAIHINAPLTSPTVVVETMRPGIPRVPELFVARSKEIDELLGALAPAGTGVLTAVEGMGGVGKTALARQVAGIAVDRGWFAVACVVDFRGYEPDEDAWVRPEHAAAPLLRILAGAELPVTAAEQLAVYQQILDTEQRVLLVFDNVCTGAQVRGLIPTHPAHRVLVTTRDTVHLPGTPRRITLDALASDDAIQLLDGIVTRAGDAEESRQLVSACGGLPLAVEIAAALLVEDPDLAPAELTTELRTSPAPLESLRYGERTVTAVLEVSWNRLRARHPDAAQLLRLLPLNPGPDLSTAAAAALAGVEETRVRPWLRALRQAHLLQHSGGRWRMHDLVRHYGRTLSPSEPDATNRLLGHYLHTATAADEHLKTVPGHASKTTFPDHHEAAAWLDAERANLIAAVALAVQTGEYLTAFDLAESIGCYLFTRGYSAELVANYRYSATAARHLSLLQQVGALTRLAFALQRTGQFEEAIKLHRQNIRALRETGHRREHGMVFIHLGRTQTKAGLFTEALATYRRALRILQEHGDPHDESEVLRDLAGVLREMDQLAQAEPLYLRSLRIARDLGDRAGETATLKDLALVLYQTGRYEEAITACQQALDFLTETENDLGQALILTELGLALRDAGRVAEAVRTFRRAVKILRGLPAPNALASALFNLGITLDIIGLPDRAVDPLREAANLYIEAGDHRSARLAWAALGHVLTAIGRFGEAFAAHQQASHAT